MAEQSYNLKYTGKEIDDLLDKANNMDSSAQVPVGGTSGQVLTKKSGTDFDAEWKTPGSSLPSGGTPSQVLTKKSTAAGDAEWRDVPVQLPSGGYAGQILQKKSSTLNDAGWVDIPSPVNPLPTGGSAGQILAKKSDANFDTEWIDNIISGGISGAFTIPITNKNGNYTAEYTYQSVIDAVNSGKVPFLIDEENGEFYILANYTNSPQGVSRWQCPQYDFTSITTIKNVKYITWNAFATGTGHLSKQTYSFAVLPTGGTTGQVLVKKSDKDYDVYWKTI